jgi:dTDP-4-dehydrorhamnose 3,5-epimerase
MEKKDFSVYELEKHETKDVRNSHINGDLTVIWRDWDKIINNPEMVYVNTINPNEIKGPHIHKNRTSYFFCLHGRVILVIQENNEKYTEIEINSDSPKLVEISNGVAAAIVNPSNDISKVLVLADIAWKPNDGEMINTNFDNYDLKRWGENR